MQYNMNVPATLKVLLTIGKPAAVDPLHCATVPFSLAEAVHVSVEVISTIVVELIIIMLAVFVMVATKSKSSHRTAATLLQSKLLPMVSVLVNSISIGQNEWFNYPFQKKPLCDSAGVSHHLSRTDPSHTHTGVQDNSSCTYTIIGQNL